ncbi:hypothetical protein [Sodalis praecaptivus]|nr:hypothetical protein [Sodalis praecaptivus]
MSKETGGQAFPVQGYEGVTIRDYFAKEALGLCYAQYLNYAEVEGFHEDWRTGVAIDAYMMADAMLAARASNS